MDSNGLKLHVYDEGNLCIDYQIKLGEAGGMRKKDGEDEKLKKEPKGWFPGSSEINRNH